MLKSTVGNAAAIMRWANVLIVSAKEEHAEGSVIGLEGIEAVISVTAGAVACLKARLGMLQPSRDGLMFQ